MRCGSAGAWVFSFMPAVIHPSALVGSDVVLGEGCQVGPFCNFTGRVRVGAACRFGTGVVIGGEPMDRAYQGEDSGVMIGAGNVFFEFVTVHRAVGEGNWTVVGDGNYIMSYVHIAHNCQVGNGCVITSGVLLGGYSQVDDLANLGGGTGVHQFCRIGRLAMVGAHSYVNRDIPPFLLAAGRPCRVRGLNRVGLQRAGMGAEKVKVLEELFRIVYRTNLPLSEALKRVEGELLHSAASEEVRCFLEFCASSRRGIELRSGPEEEE